MWQEQVFYKNRICGDERLQSNRTDQSTKEKTMKTKRKIVLLALCCVMIMTIFVGCNSQLRQEKREYQDRVTELNALVERLEQEKREYQNRVADLDEKVERLEEERDVLKERISNRVFIYVAEGTLPIMNSFLHVLGHNYPSYMLFGRADTFDHRMLPNHVSVVREPTGVVGRDAIVLRELVEALETKYNQPYFHFFGECINALTPFYIRERAGISRERFQITLLSDGANHGGIFLNLPAIFPPPGFAAGDALFTGPQGLDNWHFFRSSFEEFWLPLFATDEALTLEQYDSFRPTWAYMWAAAMQPNVDFWVSFPGWFFMQDVHSAILGDLMGATLIGRKAYDLLSALESHRRELFFEATLNNPNFAIEGVGSIRDMLDNYFNYSDKPVMIVSGTHVGTVSGIGTDASHFISALEEIIVEFGDNYRLMYKPHPSWNRAHPYNAPLLEFLEYHDISILPPRLPMEAIMWAYPDIQIGGYNSTLYISARANQVRFFIGELVGTVDFLYQSGAFPLATGVRFGV